MPSWPHGPDHWLFTPGLYMVTAGTLEKRFFFDSPLRRDFLQASLLATASEFGWQLQAWAVFANHYHFVALSPEQPGSLGKMLGKLHAMTARQLDKEEEAPRRK